MRTQAREQRHLLDPHLIWAASEKKAVCGFLPPFILAGVKEALLYARALALDCVTSHDDADIEGFADSSWDVCCLTFSGAEECINVPVVLAKHSEYGVCETSPIMIRDEAPLSTDEQQGNTLTGDC